MRNPHAIVISHQPDALTLAATTWLACGAVLLGLTPLPLHDATLGWSPAFWLLAAPALLLVTRRMQGARRVALVCRTLTHPGSRRTPPPRRWRTRSPSEATPVDGKAMAGGRSARQPAHQVSR